MPGTQVPQAFLGAETLPQSSNALARSRCLSNQFTAAVCCQNKRLDAFLTALASVDQTNLAKIFSNSDTAMTGNI